MNFTDLNLPPETEATLVGLYEQREFIDEELNNTPPTLENRKKIYGLQNQRNRVVGAINNLIFSSDKEYADEEFGYQVFKWIADHPQMDNTKRENIHKAMESARLECKREAEWVDEVKGNNYLFTASILRTLASNGDLDLLRKFKTLKKKHIVDRGTLNAAAGEFSDQKSLAERLEELTQSTRELKKDRWKLESLKEVVEAHSKLFSMSGDWEERAEALREQGFSLAAISSAIGVSIDKVKKWSANRESK